MHAPVGGLDIKNYWGSDGIVEDWDAAPKLWEYTITSRLTGAKAGDPTKNGLNDLPANGESMDVEMEGVENNEKPMEDSPLMMTEPGWNSAKAREKYIEIAMEDWGVPAFYLQKTGVLAAFASGKASGIIIDVGASHTSVTPVLDGMVLRKGVQKSPLAGNFVSQQIRRTFKNATPEIPLTPHYLVKSKTQVDAGAPANATYKTFPVPPSDSFRLNEEERVLTEFKESVVEVWPGPGRFTNGTNEEMAKSAPGRPFEMPDGWNNVFGSERFRVAEGLFDASAALTSEGQPKPKDEPEDTCKPVPVQPRGGNKRHNECADKVPNNMWPGFSVKVNGKEFDALQKGKHKGVLWEIKTDNFSDYAGKSEFMRKIVLERMLAEFERERALAMACKFEFIVGVTDPGLWHELDKLNKTLKLNIQEIKC